MDSPPERTTVAMELCTARLLNATGLADADAAANAFRGDGWRVIKDMMISIKIKNQT